MVDTVAFIISYFSLGFFIIYTAALLYYKKRYYIVLDYRLLFVFGLAFSRFLSDYAVTFVLAWYFTYYGDHLVMSSILSNIQSSLSSILVIFMAHAADSYVGRFNTILFSNTAYICGLMLLWLFNPYDVKWLVVIALVLISLGTSGAFTLQDVLLSLVKDIDKPKTETEIERSVARADMLLRLAYVLSAISAVLWVATDAVGGVYQSWQRTFLICMITMTLASVIFCTGHKNYHQDRLTKRPFQIFVRVFRDLIKKLLKNDSWRSKKLSRQDRPMKNLKTENKGNERIPQEEPTLTLDTNDNESKRISTSYNQKDMVVIKRLLRMFPMWAMFFVVSIISATGSTFFILQYSNLNVSKIIPIQIYNIAQDFSNFAIPFLYRGITCSHKNEKVKIGVGMLFGIISCVFAWRLEVYRLKEVGYLIDKESSTSISFLWLVPQFCLLGFMEGLTKEGLLNFYKLEMKEHPQLIDNGEEYIEIVMGLGTLMNIFLMLIFNKVLGWFGDTINDSRLDRYYLVLVCACLVNFVLYSFVARYYYKDEDMANNNNNEGNDNQVLANDRQEQDDHILPDNDHKKEESSLR